MIFVLLAGDYRFTVDRYLASYGRRFLRSLQPIPYAQILSRTAFRPGAYMFTDMDRLNSGQLRRAEELWTILSQRPDCRVVNHPTQSMQRLALLNDLYARGVNAFQAHRADGELAHVRFPAFLRRAGKHKGPESELVLDAAQLASAVARFCTAGRLNDWLVVEYCETADPDGWYRKYSAFRIGGRIIPRHLLLGRSWIQKESESTAPEHLEEEMRYVAENPHRDDLMRLFEAARIEYGRLDYSFRQGQMQVWEINFNPSLPWRGNAPSQPRRATHQAVSDQLAVAWWELAEGLPHSYGYPAEYLRTLRWVAAETWYTYRPARLGH